MVAQVRPRTAGTSVMADPVKAYLSTDQAPAAKCAAGCVRATQIKQNLPLL